MTDSRKVPEFSTANIRYRPNPRSHRRDAEDAKERQKQKNRKINSRIGDHFRTGTALHSLSLSWFLVFLCVLCVSAVRIALH